MIMPWKHFPCIGTVTLFAVAVEVRRPPHACITADVKHVRRPPHDETNSILTERKTVKYEDKET